MDGAELAACVNKPCIKADDECYNCEWSTELYVPQAQDEYIKAWFLLSFMAKEYGLGSMDGFQFNISVGYDLAGIRSEKINTFIENMKNAADTPAFKECKAVLLAHAEEFRHVTREDIEAISPEICNSATISTLHGCPPQEIESIANYLLTEKHMHTFIKCNPTLLGYDFARERLDQMGYDYIAFGRFHFEDDLQYADAVPMFQRLIRLSGDLGLEFGVKITNTFPVDVKAGELPSEEMYMSGKSLFPLSIALAAKLSGEFDGKLRIAYSGGADAFNIDRIVGAGVWPVTMATTILKPGGYQRLKQIAEILDTTGVRDFTGIDVEALNKVADSAVTDKHHVKPAKLPVSRKTEEKVPLLDCYTAPCEDVCPLHQEITAYMKLSGEGKYEEALKVILNRNALPFITGTICAHPCQSHCTRNFYETSVQIRDTKLTCAQNGFDRVIEGLAPEADCGKKAAVVGGGNTAMDTARAAKRCEGVEHVYIVYRRTKRYMPADEHELMLAVEDGVEFRELLAPVRMEEGSLICEEMVLGERDASGRAGVRATGNTVEIPADTVIAAVGEKVPADFYEANGIHVDEKGRALVSDKLETNLEGVYVIGDGLYGPSLVVKGAANAIQAAEAITGRTISESMSEIQDAIVNDIVLYNLCIVS